MTTRSSFAVIILGVLFTVLTAPPAGAQSATRLAEDSTPGYPSEFAQAENVVSILNQAENLFQPKLITAPSSSAFAAAAVTNFADAARFLLLTQLSQLWDAQANGGQGDWMNEGLVTYTRASDGSQTELLIESWDDTGGMWENDLRRRSIQRGDSSITLDESWDSDTDAWLPAQRRSLTTDAEGNRVSTTELWDEDAGAYFIWFRSTETLDGQGRVLTLISESGLFGPLAPGLKYTFTYNSDGTTASRFHESYNRNTGEFENAGLREWTYDSNGEEIRDLELDWDDASGDWVNDHRTVTEYEPSSSNPTSVTETEHDWDLATGAWMNDERAVTTVEGSEITETEQEWDASANNGQGDWANLDQSITTLSDDGPVLIVSQEWDDGQSVWVNEDQSTVEYDDRGLPVWNLFEIWDGAAWMNENLLTMTYGEFETPTAAETDGIASGYELGTSYPNPFSESTTIRFTLPEPAHVSLEVFDMLGRRVQTLVATTLSTGDHAVTLDARNLPGGLYFLRFGTERFRASRSVLLVK